MERSAEAEACGVVGSPTGVAAKLRRETLGKRIANRRRLLELDQDKLARLCQVAPAAVREWEADRGDPAPHLNDLASALMVSIEWLETGAGSFGERLRQRRQQLRLSLPALARLLGDDVCVRTLRSWENDRAWPKTSKRKVIADRLGVPLEWLLTGVGLPQVAELTVEPVTDETFMHGVAHLKMAFGLRFDREAERLLLMQDGSLRRAREGKEGLPVHAKYAIAAALGWNFDRSLVFAMLSEIQRAKVQQLADNFGDIDGVRRRPTRKPSVKVRRVSKRT